jgi:sugar phosphate isomerase/epimerase
MFRHTDFNGFAPQGFGRRSLLKMAGLTLLGATARPAEAKHLWTKAKKNFRLGIFSHVYRKLPMEEALARIKADGFRSIVTDFSFADVKFDWTKPDWEAVKKVRACLDRNGLAVAGLYGYYNVVSPVPERRRKGRERMEFLLTNWKRFGSANVTTETGTYNTKSDWQDAPKNTSEEGYQECRREIAGLVKVAEKSGAVVSIEQYWRNIIGTIDRAERLFRDIPSPALKLTMDPSNLFRPEDLPRMKPMLVEMFRRLGPQIVLAHAKDVRVTEKGQDHPAAGLGVLDYATYLELLAKLDRPLDLMLEHVMLDDVPRARDYVLGKMDKLP